MYSNTFTQQSAHNAQSHRKDEIKGKSAQRAQSSEHSAASPTERRAQPVLASILALALRALHCPQRACSITLPSALRSHRALRFPAFTPRAFIPKGSLWSSLCTITSLSDGVRHRMHRMRGDSEGALGHSSSSTKRARELSRRAGSRPPRLRTNDEKSDLDRKRERGRVKSKE